MKVTVAVLASLFVAQVSGACNKDKLQALKSKMAPLQTAAEEKCKDPEVAKNKLTPEQIKWFLDELLPEMFNTVVGSIPVPDDYKNPAAVKKVAETAANACQSKLNNLNICTDDKKPLQDCMSGKLVEMLGEQASWFTQNCNKILDVVAQKEFQDKVEGAVKAKFQSFPKN